MSEAKHSPTPWRVADDGPALVVAADGKPVMSRTRPTNHRRPDCERDANLELVVRAVNCHADLLAACELLDGLDWVAGYEMVQHELLQNALDAARAAIKKAKGEG